MANTTSNDGTITAYEKVDSENLWLHAGSIRKTLKDQTHEPILRRLRQFWKNFLVVGLIEVLSRRGCRRLRKWISLVHRIINTQMHLITGIFDNEGRGVTCGCTNKF